MTVIAGLVSDGRVYMAGDRAVTAVEGGDGYFLSDAKVWRRGRLVLGYTGSVTLDAKLKACRTLRQVLDVLDGPAATSVQVLAGWRGEIYLVESGCAMPAEDGCLAIGTGWEAAMVALRLTDGDPAERAARAVEETARVVWGVRCGPDGPDVVSC